MSAVKLVRAPIIELAKESIVEPFSTEIVGVVDQLAPLDVLALALDYNIPQIVQASGLLRETEVLTSQIMIEGDTYFECPLATIFDPQHATPTRERELRGVNFPFHSSEQRETALRTVHRFVASHSSSNSVQSDVCLAADELFTNAIYNAPFASTREGQTGASRRTSFAIDPNQRATLFAGCDGTRLVVGCTDQFGTLNLKALLSRARDCASLGASAMIRWDAEGGAGIGCYMLYSMSMGFYVGVQDERKSVVCCSFPLGLSDVKRSRLLKNLHLCKRS